MEKDLSKVPGGKARAEALTKEERTEIARRAALMRWSDGVLSATHQGELRIGNIILQCMVLEDGRRMLSQRGVNSAFGGSQGGLKAQNGAQNLPRFLASKAIIPFISEDLMVRLNSPVIFKPKHGGRTAHGYEASLLPRICGVILDAKNAGALKHPELAITADILLRAFAEVGIAALIDEATGYQEIRDRHALQAILDKFLAKELAAWAKQFPDEFYQQIFRLRDWQWRGMKVNRPQCVANYTKDIVYERLAPGIVNELEKRNPVESGRRKAKHHQWLTSDVGHPALSQHLHAVVGIMRISNGWSEFKRHLDRAFPRKGETLEMLID